MREEAKGSTIADEEVTIAETTVRALATALGTGSGGATATLLPFFGATIGGESGVVDGLGMDLSHSLLAGLGYEWHRPFTVGETVRVRVTIEDVYTKGRNQFGLVVAEFTDQAGDPVQRQTITFIERGNQ